MKKYIYLAVFSAITLILNAGAIKDNYIAWRVDSRIDAMINPYELTGNHYKKSHFVLSRSTEMFEGEDYLYDETGQSNPLKRNLWAANVRFIRGLEKVKRDAIKYDSIVGIDSSIDADIEDVFWRYEDELNALDALLNVRKYFALTQEDINASPLEQADKDALKQLIERADVDLSLMMDDAPSESTTKAALCKMTAYIEIKASTILNEGKIEKLRAWAQQS